jgi:hexulose-6-phosphate isomerase
MMNRRTFLASTGVALAGSALFSPAHAQDKPPAPAAAAGAAAGPKKRPKLKKAVNIGMAGGVKGSVEDKFKAIKEAGFDGIELNLPDDHWDVDTILKAKQASGLEVAGIICTTHWGQPLSDPKPEVREGTVRALNLALKQGGEIGCSRVLLVPGKVTRTVNYEDCWKRSIEGIKRCVETAAAAKCHIAVENVWNMFINNPVEAARYVDEINNPWVGWHFDIGNCVTYGWPEQWVRTLGKRIRNLHIKDYSRSKRDKGGPGAGFGVELGESWIADPKKDDGVNWTATMEALDEIGYEGYGILEVGGGDLTRLKFLAERTDTLFAA